MVAEAHHYMGDLRTRGTLSYPNIPLNLKEHLTGLLSENRRKIIVKVVINHYFPSINLKEILF
jgi:hypothetical protein